MKERRHIAVALWSVAFLAQAQMTPPRDSYGPIEWPKERQHELAGHYAGTLRNPDCENISARLTLGQSHDYALTMRCTEPGKATPEQTLDGRWWIDEIAGSCLILDQEKIFGFRISDDARVLSLDGGDCTAADERDDPHQLIRTDPADGH